MSIKVEARQRIQRVYNTILFLFWFSTALPMALGVLLMQARGMDLFQVGLLLGLYSLTIVVLEVPTGGLADAIGRRRVTFLAYVVITLSGVVELFAFSLSAFALAHVLYGVGRALASGALEAWFVDALQAADPRVALQPALAQADTFSLLALGTGALLGGVVPRFFAGLPADGTAVLTPIAMTIVLALPFKVLMLVVLVWGVKEERSVGESTLKAIRKGVRQVPRIIGDAFTLSRQNPTVLLLLGAAFAAGLAVISLEALWQPHFAALLGGAQNQTFFFGVVMAGSFLVGMAGNLLSVPLCRLLRQRYGLVAAIFQALRGLFLVLLAFQTGVVPAVILFWLVYLHMGIVNSPHATLVNREIPAERRSSMLSVQSLATYVGAMVGSAGLGYVAERASVGVAWTIAGVVLIGTLYLYLRVEARRAKADNQPLTAESVSGVS